jgi:uncharacterized protein involved in cysteine biosynthesis
MLPDVARGTVVTRFLSGARCAASGIGFTLRHGALLRWSLVPMVVQLAIFVALVVAGWQFLGDLPAPEAGHWYSFLGTLLKVVVAVLMVIAGALLAIFLGGIVCDPFYDILSERTESILLGRDVGEPFSVSAAVAGIVRELLATVARLAVYGGGQLALLLLGLTGVGSVVAVPLSLAWTWLFVAVGALSRSQARHQIAGGKRFSAAFGNTAVALGFGAAGWLLAYLPFTAAFLVVGGTRLYLSLAAHDRVASALADADKRRLVG